jgi:stearoyl-CoA desaturase (delta-9 desaturase)
VYLWGWAAGLGFAWLSIAILYNLGDMIDSVAHDRKGPVDRPWLAILTAGEGWHIEHHQVPGSARLGFHPGQFDLAWTIIRCLETMGWAKVEQVYGRR